MESSSEVYLRGMPRHTFPFAFTRNDATFSTTNRDSRSLLEFCRRVLNSVDLLVTWLAIVTINLPLECPTSNHDKIRPKNTQIMRNQRLLLLENG
mmetsp:Transcript_27348/g.50403  ORF Transcript_27348/g.50403 Transcript_27348/m.50403 type:complete len:95 (-) Transcript_27348:641-925(-)